MVLCGRASPGPWHRGCSQWALSHRQAGGRTACVCTHACACVSRSHVSWLEPPQDLGPDPTPSRLVCQQVHESLSCGEKARLCPTCPSVLSRTVGCRGSGAALCSAGGSWRAAQHESGLRGCREICLDCLCLRLGRRAVRWGHEREWSRQTSTPERVIAQGPDEDGTLEVFV